MELAANGNITDENTAGGVMISAESLLLFAIGGDIGTPDDPAKLAVLNFGAHADEIYVINAGDLVLGVVAAQGGVGIRTDGSITQAPGGFVQGGNVTLLAGGNIGSTFAPLLVNANNLTVRGNDLTIMSIGNLGWVTITGNTVVLRVNGALTGGTIAARNLAITSLGSIGAAGAPLKVRVPGKLTTVSIFGEVFVVNQLFRSACLVGIRLDGAYSGKMLYLLLGLNLRGEMSIIGAAIADAGDADSMNALWMALREMDVGLAGVALIDGLGDMEGVFAQIFTTLFPKTLLLAASIFWIAAVRGEVDPADWNALLTDYAAIYACLTADDAQSAITLFGEHWGAKYPAISERVGELAKDLNKVVEIGTALTRQDMNVKQMTNVLADFFDSAAFKNILENGG